MDHVNCGCGAIMELANDVRMEKEREHVFIINGTKKKNHGNVAMLEIWPTITSLRMW
jgi:hypothetical protein